MNENDLKSMLETVAYERLSYARGCDPGNKEGDEAFNQGVKAVQIYTELTKVDDAHEEQLERREMEKQKDLREAELKMNEVKIGRVIKVAEVVVIGIGAPIVGYFCNKGLAKFLCKAEQFETFTTTAGRSLGRAFKFGK